MFIIPNIRAMKKQIGIQSDGMIEGLKNLADKTWLNHDCIKHSLTNLRRGISVLNVEQIISDIFSRLKDLPQRLWLEVEDFSSFTLDQNKIWPVLDCSFRTEDGGITFLWLENRPRVKRWHIDATCNKKVQPRKSDKLLKNLLVTLAPNQKVWSWQLNRLKLSVALIDA